MHTTYRRRAGAVLATVLVLAACGGGSDDDASEPTSDEAPTTEATEPTSDSDEADEESSLDPEEPADGDGVADEAGGDAPAIADADFEPGEVVYRTVNMLDEPVDLYVITDGIREAWTVESSVAPLAVTEFAAPPVDGRYLITTEGAGDPTCVVDCTGHIAELANGFVDDVFTRTVLLYADPDDGSASAFEIWEDAGPDDAGTTNAMPPADPTTTLVSVSALAVSNTDFGMRFSVDGAEDCLTNLTGDTRLIGGNQVLTYDTAQATSFTIHGNDDSDCTGEPVGGPFSIDATPGARYHGILYGDATAVEALIVPMSGNPEGGAATADPAARDAAVVLMTEEVVTVFGLADSNAECTAELLVDAIGADVLVVDGELVELDSLPDETADVAGGALVESVEVCGNTPADFGG